MTNFNHERIGIIIQCLRFSRVCFEESVKYANKRKTFGKKLMEHPVIRLKLAHMARQIEASYNWLENLIYQCEKMGETEAMLRLGGPIAGLKAQATVTFEFCAREASQIFGGLSYSRGGQGGKVERLYRDVRAYAIPGGSEEIMLDLSMSVKIPSFCRCSHVIFFEVLRKCSGRHCLRLCSRWLTHTRRQSMRVAKMLGGMKL